MSAIYTFHCIHLKLKEVRTILMSDTSHRTIVTIKHHPLKNTWTNYFNEITFCEFRESCPAKSVEGHNFESFIWYFY